MFFIFVVKKWWNQKNVIGGVVGVKGRCEISVSYRAKSEEAAWFGWKQSTDSNWSTLHITFFINYSITRTTFFDNIFMFVIL